MVSFSQAIEASKKGGQANLKKISDYVEQHRCKPRDIYQCDEKGCNLLSYASDRGDAEMFQILLSALIIEEVLRAAINSGSDGIFLMLLPCLDLDMLTNKSCDGLTPAEFAQINGQAGMAIELVEMEQKFVAALPLSPQAELDAIGYDGPIPVELTCDKITLSGKLMTRPVTINGFTYEYSAIKDWADNNRDEKDNFSCPMTRKMIPYLELIRPTNAKDITETKRIKNAIADFVRAQKKEKGLLDVAEEKKTALEASALTPLVSGSMFSPRPTPPAAPTGLVSRAAATFKNMFG